VNVTFQTLTEQTHVLFRIFLFYYVYGSDNSNEYYSGSDRVSRC